MLGLDIKRSFIRCLLILLIFSGCGKDGGGGSSPTSQKAIVAISSSSDTINAGDTFPLTVEVKNVGKTFYTAFDLTYDPNVIAYVNAVEGPFLNQNGSDTTAFQVSLENGMPGRLIVGLTRLGEVEEVSGSGVLFSLSFKGVGSGTTTLAFEDPKGFKNGTNQDVAIDTWGNRKIIVQ